MDEPRRPRRHPNADERRALQTAELHRFAKLYARKAQKGVEPNDRRYDRGIEKKIRRMSPEELDRILREEES